MSPQVTAGKSKVGFCILGAMGLVFCVFGFWAGYIQAGRVRMEAGSISNLPELDWSAFHALAPGTKVIVSGTLAEHGLAADLGGLIICIEELWAVQYNDSETSAGWEGSWNWAHTRFPDIGLDGRGGTIRITQGQGVVIENTLHEQMFAVPRDGREVDGIKAGSVRHRGFMAGDEITAVGIIEGGAVVASRVHGGNRAALERHLGYQVSGLRIAGLALGLAGLALLGVAGMLAYRRPRA